MIWSRIVSRRVTVRLRLPRPHSRVDEIAAWRFTAFGDVVAVAAHPEDRHVVLYVREDRGPLTEAVAFLSPGLSRTVGAALVSAARHADRGGL